MKINPRFIASNAGVHITLPTQPLKTLCGWAFTADGSADPQDGLFQRAAALAPFIETGEAPVTCPACCEIIETLSSLTTEPFESPGLDPDDQPLIPDG